MRTIMNQQGTAFFVLAASHFFNVSKAELDGVEYFSVGVENVSLALYRKQKHAVAALRAVLEFVNDETRKSFQFGADVTSKR